MGGVRHVLELCRLVAEQQHVGALGHLRVRGERLAAQFGRQGLRLLGNHVGEEGGLAEPPRRRGGHVPCPDQPDLHAAEGYVRLDSRYDWLKKPFSISRARSSADTSTLRGVRRNTLSAIRCIPPSSAYVRPDAKSINRFDRSTSVPCRLRITGIESLNWSATCWASLKFFGITGSTCTPPRPPFSTGRSTRVRLPWRGGASSSAKMSSISSRRRREDSLRTFGRSR